MPARAVSLDELTADVPNLVLLVGDEEFLIARAISTILIANRRNDADVVESEHTGAGIDGPELHELLGPTLFGTGRVLVVRSGQDLSAGALAALRPYLNAPVEGTRIIVQHAGAAKGKAVLEAIRSAGAPELSCARLTRAEERLDFVRSEVRRCGGSITPEAVAALADAVGSDLRELASACAQLVADSGGTVDADVVRAYHRGRAEVTGFAVADLAVGGRVAEALQTLRHALDIGVAEVLIADALADGVRSIARVAAAGRGDPGALAAKLGMPPWKVRKAAGQARGWTEFGIRRALGVVADVNADVKGVAADPRYALERAIRELAAARAAR